jgi:aminotransferase
MASIRNRDDSAASEGEIYTGFRNQGNPKNQEVIDLLVAFPHFSPPTHVQEAFKNAVDREFFHYGSTRGYLPLRQAISRFLSAERGIKRDPEREIIVASGASGALFPAIWAFIRKGDEVIIPDPTFQMITNNVVMAGGTPVFIPLSKDFQFPTERISDAVSSRARMICLVNPDNPTGTVYSEETVREIARLACERNLLVLTDEVHDHFVYEGAPLSRLLRRPLRE